MQQLLRSVRWDAETVRDQVRSLVAERLGHPHGVLIVDETGFLKKGTCSAGVQRQYTGTPGRVEAQVVVFLSYASPNDILKACSPSPPRVGTTGRSTHPTDAR